MSRKHKQYISIAQFIIFLWHGAAFASGEIVGTVVDKGTQEPLMGVNVVIPGTQLGAATGADGNFMISRIPAGDYELQASIMGYEVSRMANIQVKDDATVEVTFQLSEQAVPLEAVVVTTGHFSMMQKEPTVHQTLKREDIRSFSQLGEDVYRAITRLPGLSGNDYSSKFTVRGGENEEVLVLLDGLELYEPFHLKDFGGSVSVIDVEAIGGIDMITGAFPAQYGDRLSGVFNISSATSGQGKRRTSVGISFMNARFLTEGNFGAGKGQWLVLGRRGYIDLVLSLIGEDDDISPTYYDILGKVQFQFNENHAVSAHYLLANDRLNFVDNEDDVYTTYGNMYGWVNWNARLLSHLYGETVLSFGHVDQNREGTDLSSRDGSVISSAADARDFNFQGLKQDWHLSLSERFLLKGGFDAKRVAADYDYFNQDRKTDVLPDGTFAIRFDTTRVLLSPTGNEFGAYLSEKVRLLRPLTMEVGLRYDRASWADDNAISPRFNLAYVPGGNTAFRLGWGRFYQSQGIHKLDVQDGEELFYPAELAEHRVIGFEQTFAKDIKLRVEAYQKKLSHIRPRYQNLSNQIEAFPEVVDDRIRVDPEQGEAKGIEFYLKKDTGGKISWWVSYAYAFAEEEIGGLTVPRNFDQRHTIYLDLNYRPNPKWRINLAWQYHSGWPYTASTFERVDLPNGQIFVREIYGPLNAERFPAYHRMDVRINRYFDISKGRLSFFLELRNLYNRKNVRLYDYDLFLRNDGRLIVERVQEHWLPLLPSIGLSWDF